MAAVDLTPYLAALGKGRDPAVALGAVAGEPRSVLRAVASLQDGQLATRQARAAGLSRDGLRALVTSGEAEIVRPGVSRFRSAPGDPDPAVTAWLLCWPLGVVSRTSAAAHFGVRSAPSPRQPEVTLPFGVRCNAAGITVHRTRSLPPDDRLLVNGVVYTSLARTVCDLADATDPWATLSVLDDAVALGARPRWIHTVARRLVNGRAGVRVLVHATAPGAAAELRSWLERASATIYRLSRLPDPEWNARVHDAVGLIGIVDALWRPWRVVSEKEGMRFHTAPRQRRKDAERFNRLLAAGFLPRRFTWEDVVRRPTYVAATIAAALRSAGADVDLTAIPSRIELPALPFVS